jgi:pyrroline-5-carboxylate reductase
VHLPNPTWFIGCGNMAGAMIEGWRGAGVGLSGATVIRPSGLPVRGVRTLTAPEPNASPPRLVVLGFKPQKLDEVAPGLTPYLSSKTIVVSMLAGTEVASLRQRFPTVAAVIRILPNLPVSVRRGVTALYVEDVSPDARELVEPLMSALGFAMWTQREDQLAAIGSVAGAGPAYVARFIDALAKAGEERGLSAELARIVAVETVFGTAWMASGSSESMDEIARRVASPNGTTEAGLKVLDDGAALDSLVSRTIEAASKRGAELAAEARRA